MSTRIAQVLTLALALGIAGLASVAHAQGPSGHAQGAARKSAPTGAEIATRARAAKLDHANRGTGTVLGGKKVAFTPAAVGRDADLEAGEFLGVLETEAIGDETGLPPGTYNLFAAKVNDAWHVYAEAKGQIVKEGLRPSVVRSEGKAQKPTFSEPGWCTTIPLPTIFGLIIVTVCW